MMRCALVGAAFDVVRSERLFSALCEGHRGTEVVGPNPPFVLFPANGCFSPDADRSRAPRPAGGVELKVDYSLVRLMEPQPRDFLCPNPLQP